MLRSRQLFPLVLIFCSLFILVLLFQFAKPPNQQPPSPKPSTPHSVTVPVSTETPQVLPASDAPSTYIDELVPVLKVVDGDTITVSLKGIRETVRLIGINTPETVDPRKSVQCFGKEASNKAKELLTGVSVRLEADTSQGDRDKYHRLLRYVFLPDGTNFNQLMIEEGYAYEYTYALPYAYQEEFKTAQEAAMNAKKGLWSETTCSGRL